MRAPGEYEDGRKPERDFFVRGADGYPVWLTLTTPPVPTTREEIEQRLQRREQKAQEDRAERERKAAELLKNPPAHVVCLGDETPAFGSSTLRGLAERLEAQGAVIAIEGKDRQVVVPRARSTHPLSRSRAPSSRRPRPS